MDILNNMNSSNAYHKIIVVIIDDNETNLAIMKYIVAGINNDIDVKRFTDSRDAVRYCTGNIADLVLVDYMMPEMDGLAVLMALRANSEYQNVPIVMVTAINEREIRQNALGLGATDFIVKPVEPTEVKARMVNLLALRRGHLQLRDRNAWLAQEVNLATKTILAREEELIVRLSRAAEFRDTETGAHINRMAWYSRIIAAHLGLDELQCELIRRAAPMHDIGKIGIPDAILLKPGKLTDEEMAIMRKHPSIGFSILDGSDSKVVRLGAEIALTHHEKFDGTGYPNGTAGTAIPMSGRIVAVADVFDALTSARPYKKAWKLERAKDHLREESGRHFDPACVEAFLAGWEEVLSVRERFLDRAEETEALGKLCTPAQ